LGCCSSVDISTNGLQSKSLDLIEKAEKATSRKKERKEKKKKERKKTKATYSRLRKNSIWGEGFLQD
jgi:hypothetical protein